MRSVRLRGMKRCLLVLATLVALAITVTISPASAATATFCPLSECPVGYYWASTSLPADPCQPCPAGSSCAGTCATSPVACPSGHYALSASGTCSSCPAGSSCATTSVLPVQCPAGTFSIADATSCTTCPAGTFAAVAGASSCATCPAGSSCANPAIAPATCPAGTYSVEGSTTCTSCPLGSWSAAGASGCSTCPMGSFCLTPSASPALCSVGYYNAGTNSSLCAACPAGTTSSVGATTCTTCPAGYRCPGGLEAIECPVGTYNLGTVPASTCTICPAGAFCASVSSSPVGCSAGTYALAGSTSCTACPRGVACTTSTLGSACTSGQQWANGVCSACPAGAYCPAFTPIACPSGYYSAANAISCTACPAGSRCTTTAATTCSTGTYSLGTSTTCTACPIGSFCATTTNAPVACPVGSYTIAASQTACITCPAGSYCPSNSVAASPCPAGYYSLGGAIACTPCPPGSACAMTTGTGSACAAGQYNTGGSSNTCLNCPPGYACPYTTENIMHECQNGYFSLGSATVCTICPAGSYCPSTSAGPITCPSGFSTEGQTACTQCPAGFSCAASGAITQCPVGSTSIAGATTCTTCPAGYACPLSTQNPYLCVGGTYSTGGAVACSPCPVGTECVLTVVSGQSVATSTRNCQAGYYRYDLTTNPCTTCPAGYMCTDGLQYPIPCSSGTFSALGASTCTACPAGSQCPTPSGVDNAICAGGTYSIGSQARCTTCPAGYVCPAGSTTDTTPCPTGHYCPLGSDNPGQACPAGSYRDTTGAILATDCLPCPDNSACPAGSSTPQTCASGHYCPTGTGSTTEFACLPGTYLPASQAQRSSRSDCLQCPEGFYCPAGTSTPSVCPTGTYCPPGTTSAVAFPCSLGTYNSDTGDVSAAGCTTCPVGTYCPYGSSYPVPCPPGTYNPNTNSYLAVNCVACDAGKQCSTFGLSAPDGNCSVGHYCPTGTVRNTDTSCPAGRFTDSISAVQLDDCQLCPAGSACGFATGGVVTKQPCAAGHYCPIGTGSPTQYPCPAGTYLGITTGVARSDCIDCPPGSYCVGAQGAISGQCAAGYYCPLRTNSSTIFPCAAGTYLSTFGGVAQASCDACPVGRFCPTGTSTPLLCSPGTYNPNLNAIADGSIATSLAVSVFPNCLSCTAGYECPTAGMSTPTICTAGYYSPTGSAACVSCKAGYYCDVSGITEVNLLANKKCPAGYQCTTGQTSGTTNPCTAGHYCPIGTAVQLNCPIGTYNPSPQMTSLGDCLACDAGKFCLEAVSGPTAACATGYYCPTGSSSAHEVACPEGFRSTVTGATSAADCTDCPAGRYCPRGSGQGILCPTGYYCPTRRATPIPCPTGTYGNSSGLLAMSDCHSCDPGMYCDQEGLQMPRGMCDPGFYCITGATSSQPPDGYQGGLCPAGGYCPQGSAHSLPCPAGTYQNVSGAYDVSLCQLCPPGYYCGSTSNAGPTGLCYPGFYCTGSATTPIQYASPAGYYSLNGSSSATPCPVGTYAPGANSSTCLLCDAGYFCPNQSTIFITECPAGSYCDLGSSYSTACQPGTYNPFPQGRNSSACVSCPAGSYCETIGLAAVTGPCAAGYYCRGGSREDKPQSANVGGFSCPRSYYCPRGTPAPVPCNAGTYTTSTGASSQADCLPCPPGKYCEQSNLIVSGVSPYCGLGVPEQSAFPGSQPATCGAGFWCAINASMPNPTDGITGDRCQPGQYCPAGSAAPLNCSAGTYQDQPGQSTCLDCPAGSYCLAASKVSTNLCPIGYYCPAKTESPTQYPCPIGRYGDVQGTSSLNGGCLLCPPGEYCATYHAVAPTGYCQAGYYCPTTASDQYGVMNVTGSTVNLCPKGSYCPSGVSNPLPCPAGTFLNYTGATSLSNCELCPGGWYCGFAGLSVPTAICAINYYCSLNSSTPTPTADPASGLTIAMAGGDICPPGYFCLAGSSYPAPCAPGTYQDQSGQNTCKSCPAGYYCPSATVHPFGCPTGYYCGVNTKSAYENPCPIGTFNPLENRTVVADCQPCTAGSYCSPAGRSTPTAECDAGYYCVGNNTVPNPPAGACGIGNYCPKNSSSPIPCPANYYCDSTTEGYFTKTCSPGWYCIIGAVQSQPTVSSQGGSCPTGHYCPGNSAMTACTASTYNPNTRSSSSSACVPCLGGWECSNSGLAAPSNLCPSGYFCPNGTNVVTAADECPIGHMCPTGTSVPTPCPVGYYQDLTRQSTCTICPAGSYCPAIRTVTPTPCPPGSYCLAGTRIANQYLCPPGLYWEGQNATSIDYCKPCAGGYYCPHNGTTTAQGAGPCSAGYYCEGGSNTAIPNLYTLYWNGHLYTNDQCLTGSYCPAGSNTSIICPAGTFATGRGNQAFSDCKPCPRSQYCSAAGAGGSAGTYCSAGYLCVSGNTVPTPNDANGYPCPPGTYCTFAAMNTTMCAPGTFNSKEGQANCTSCTAGYYCSDHGQIAGYTCPLGSYCPTGTTQPLGCPVGSIGTTTGLTAATACTLCPQGQYCAGVNTTLTTGPCAAGYYCDIGSASAMPAGAGPLPGASALSGPCPAGYYCPAGTTAPQPCPIGTYLPANQFAGNVTQCIQCTAGQYCATQALAAPTGACFDGYLCPQGSSIGNPVPCPAGKYCKAPHVTEQNCTDGSYTDIVGRSACDVCPERSFCINSGSIPQPCPANYYCPLGTGYPIICPPGSYSSVGSLARADECMPCPAGSYCNNGVVQGPCSAGYICWSGNWLSQPNGNATVGGLCPAGSWCAEGTTEPTPCAAGTLRRTPGATLITDCLTCPLGYQCPAGDPNPVPCQVGYYCVSDSDHIPCPAGTYNPTVAATNISACLTCPAGYRCDTTGLSDPTRFPCEPGYYCQSGVINATICPSGTYNPKPLGKTIDDCTGCTGGFTCQSGSTVQVPCVGGTYCPPNSTYARPCPPQYYCPFQAAAAIPCPGGFYCPVNTTNPIYCEIGTYCDPMSAQPLECPSGHYSLTQQNRTSFNTSCAACPPGYYSPSPTEQHCSMCDGGYVCSGAANTATPLIAAQGGYLCPAGFYCPAGSGSELPCPPGSYNALTGQSSLASCLLCASNTFQDLSGQIGCKPCTASSGAPPGSTSCACIGANRAFQASDQSCICQPGFEFISDSHRLSEEDDVVDCQPIILKRCVNGQARDSKGRCVDPEGGDCSSTQCNGGAGKFSVPLGVCECSGQPTLDAVCGASCRASATKLTYANDRMTVTDPANTDPTGNITYSVNLNSIPGFIGSPDCRSTSCTFYSVIASSGLGGQYGAPPTLVNYATSTGAYRPATTQSRRAAHRSEYLTMSLHDGTKAHRAEKMEVEALTVNTATNVLNPAVICLVSGEGLLFDVSNAVNGNYPIYMKDNLLNSNPNFDWGYFRNLSTVIASNASSVSLFAFTFHSSGVYVFADNAMQDQLTIVRVVDTNQLCPTLNADPLSRIQPFQFDALIANGVQRNQNVVITPDWDLLGIMIALIFCLVALIIAGLYFFQTHSWGSGELTKPRYKQLALDEKLDVWNVFSTKGTVRSVDNVSKGLTSLMTTDAQVKELIASRAAPTKRVASIGDEEEAGLGSAVGLGSDGGDSVANFMADWENAGLGQDENDKYMNELSSHLDLEGFDFHSLYKMLDETKASVESHFEHQEDGLKVFYERMAMEIDHLKNILAVKMQVQLHKTGEGLSEAVDRLVSGELLARQAFQDLSRRRELELTKTLEQLVTCIRNLNEDYNIFPIKELVRLTNEHILYCERGLEQERNRRKIFASHTEIVGRPIIDTLAKADMGEEGIQDQYMDALKMFEASVVDLLKKMLHEEQNHASAMEKLDESSLDKRKLELDRYHLNICKLTKEIQQQLSYLDENLTPIFEGLRDMEDKTHHVWVHVQGHLLEQRWETLLNPGEGRLFRGINPELAKVLTGLLGMKGGLTVDPISGTFQPKTPFDPRDPFETIFDYQAQEKLARDEEYETDSDEEGGEGRRRRRRKSDLSADHQEPEESEVVLRKKKKRTDGESSDDDDTLEDSTTRARHAAEDEADEAVTAGIATVDADQDDARSRALGELAAKRKLVEDDDSLSDDDRANKLASLDDELDALRKLFGDDATGLIDAFKKSQAGRTDEIDEDEAEIERLKAELLSRHAELQQLEEAHTAEEAALLRQLDREDAEADENFACDLMAKFDSLLHQMDGGDGGADDDDFEGEDGEENPDGSIRRKRGNGDKKEYKEASSTLLNEYEFLINDLRAGGATDDQIKNKMSEMHALKRSQLREKRLEALRRKQEAEAAELRATEDATKEKLAAQLKDQAELASVMEVLGIKPGEAVNAAGGVAGAASIGVATINQDGTITTGGVDAPVDPKVAAEFEKERLAIERRYKRQHLDREARNAVQEAFEFAKLEFRQDLMIQNRLRAKAEKLASNQDGKQAEEELKDLLAGVDADRASLESAQELERARQKKKLQDAMDARKRNARDKMSKKKELELRAATRQLEQANKGNVRQKEQEKIEEAINKLPEADRRKLGKKVCELVMGARHAKEIEDVMGDHMEERQAFVLEAMEAATAEGRPINFMEIEQQATEKFDAPHAKQIADLIRTHQGEVRESYGKVFADATFDTPEWDVTVSDDMAEYQRRRREVMQRKAAAQGEDAGGVTDDALKKLADDAAAKQRAHELRLKAEQDEFDRMQREFDEKEDARRKKRAQLEEEAKRRELDLLDDLSEAQRSDLLNQHKLNLKNFERATDNEKVRQAGLLEKALEDRRRKLAIKKAQQKAAIEKQKAMQKEIARKEKKKLIKKLREEQATGMGGDAWKLRAVAQADGLVGRRGVGVVDVDGGVDEFDVGNESDDGVARHKKRLAKDEADRAELAQKQEVIARLRTIEGMVDKLHGQSDQWRGQIFIDEKDQNDVAYQPIGTEVVICDVSQLNPKTLVLYRFGVNLMEVLFANGLAKAPTNGIDNKNSKTPVHLLIATSLPPNVHQQTAFKNSFHFQTTQSILFIRRERLEDVGEFLLLLTHCLAHISTSARVPHAGVQTNSGSVGVVEGWDDRNPAFVQAFHALLKFICADIFYANAGKALQAAPHVLPLVQPTSSKPIMLNGESEQIEGASSSSVSVAGLSPADTAAWLGGSVRTLAIDELLDLHPVAGVNGSSSSNSIGGVHHSHHSAEFSAARMLERMHEYHSFAHASVLKTSLIELEKNSRQREHAREVKESRTFRQRAVRGAPPPTPNDDKAWQDAPERVGQSFGEEKLHDIEDELTAELSVCIEQLYGHTHALHQAEQDLKELKLKSNLTASDQANIAKLNASIVNEKSDISQLSHQKDHCIYRLRNVNAAVQQLAQADEKKKSSSSSPSLPNDSTLEEEEEEETQ